MFHLERSGGQCFTNISCLFTWSGTAIARDSDPFLRLVFNSTIIRQAYMQRTDSNADSRGTSGTCSQTAIIRCSTGITAYLYYYTSIARLLLADYSVFSGYLIPNQ